MNSYLYSSDCIFCFRRANFTVQAPEKVVLSVDIMFNHLYMSPTVQSINPCSKLCLPYFAVIVSSSMDTPHVRFANTNEHSLLDNCIYL